MHCNTNHVAIIAHLRSSPRPALACPTHAVSSVCCVRIAESSQRVRGRCALTKRIVYRTAQGGHSIPMSVLHVRVLAFGKMPPLRLSLQRLKARSFRSENTHTSTRRASPPETLQNFLCASTSLGNGGRYATSLVVLTVMIETYYGRTKAGNVSFFPFPFSLDKTSPTER